MYVLIIVKLILGFCSLSTEKSWCKSLIVKEIILIFQSKSSVFISFNKQGNPSVIHSADSPLTGAKVCGCQNFDVNKACTNSNFYYLTLIHQSSFFICCIKNIINNRKPNWFALHSEQFIVRSLRIISPFTAKHFCVLFTIIVLQKFISLYFSLILVYYFADYVV